MASSERRTRRAIEGSWPRSHLVGFARTFALAVADHVHPPNDAVDSPSVPELALRIVVHRPPSGVTFAVQRGSAELLAPTSRTPDALVFDFTVRVSGVTQSGASRFLGPYTQGPSSARFVYVNSGQRAGQVDTPWDRRAKVPLGGITAAMIREAKGSAGARIETEFEGTARDGGPTCASVKSIAWRVVRRQATPSRPSHER